MLIAKLWFGVTVVFIPVLLLGACTPTGSPSPTSSSAIAPASTEQPETTPAPYEDSGAGIGDKEPVSSDNLGGPVLSNALMRGCKRTRPSGGFESAGLAVEETAVDFTLRDVHGNEASLAGLLSEKPVVMVFGSFT